MNSEKICRKGLKLRNLANQLIPMRKWENQNIILTSLPRAQRSSEYFRRLLQIINL